MRLLYLIMVLFLHQDEYVGIPEDHPESYHSFMFTNFFNHVNIPRGNINILNGNAVDLQGECDQVLWILMQYC